MYRPGDRFGGVGDERPISGACGPGAQSYLDLAREDCFGTARNTTSKVWYSVADGVLSDTFSPSLQNSNVNTVQYIVTAGRSFADMQQRDVTYTASSWAQETVTGS
jgi:glucoamylase